jgi:hypothetical protein
MSADCNVCCTVDACSFIYVVFFLVSSLEENSCAVSLNARLIEYYVCSTMYDNRQAMPTVLYTVLV